MNIQNKEFKVGDFVRHVPSNQLAWIINDRYELLWSSIGSINQWSGLSDFRKTKRKFNIKTVLNKGLKKRYMDNLTYIEILARVKHAK